MYFLLYIITQFLLNVSYRSYPFHYIHSGTRRKHRIGSTTTINYFNSRDDPNSIFAFSLCTSQYFFNIWNCTEHRSHKFGRILVCYIWCHWWSCDRSDNRVLYKSFFYTREEARNRLYNRSCDEYYVGNTLLTQQ